MEAEKGQMDRQTMDSGGRVPPEAQPQMTTVAVDLLWTASAAGKEEAQDTEDAPRKIRATATTTMMGMGRQRTILGRLGAA
jgi:hypothetical protein